LLFPVSMGLFWNWLYWRNSRRFTRLRLIKNCTYWRKWTKN